MSRVALTQPRVSLCLCSDTRRLKLLVMPVWSVPELLVMM